MKQNTDGVKLLERDISIEEFDAPVQVHEFSRGYKKAKMKMLREYRREVYGSGKTGIIKAAAVIFLFLTVPVLAATASGSEFFSRIWGVTGKKNIESHTEEVYDEQKKDTYAVTYPQRDYTDDYLDKAGELIGDAVAYRPVAREIGDTRLTVLALVCDGNAAVVEFTLEREGGVNCLEYSQLDNESKGAWFAPDCPFYFRVAEGNENIYVDLDKSTQEKLYCYDYITLDSPEKEVNGLTIQICKLSDTEEVVSEDMEEVTDEVFVPIQKKVESRAYVNGEGGSAGLSPISMKIDVTDGLGLSDEQAYDPWHVYYVSVNYKDGTNYVVHEHEIEGIHSCEAEIDNASYTCGGADGRLTFVFNRLVDIENVESIVVNEAVYMPE